MMKTAERTDAPIELALGRVIEIFDAELASELPFVRRLVEHVHDYRGKLLRPRLVLLTASAIGDLRREHLTIAAVVEMVHMATLVHDDVLDEADVRRRTATINRLAGNEAAVMLGDFLISHAYHLCSSLGSVRIARRVAAATNTVCEGELMQIHHRGNYDLTEEAYIEIIRRKTGALTGVCCELAAAACDASEKTVHRMATFGSDLGIAFQIIDDVLDLTGSTQQLGKSAGRDAQMGKLTLPVIRYLQRAPSSQRDRLMAVLQNPSEGHSAAVRQLLQDTDALDYATNLARTYIDSALSQLSDLPDSEAKQSLIFAAQFVIDRRN
jgi:octaprenyl-diphosphate synthase